MEIKLKTIKLYLSLILIIILLFTFFVIFNFTPYNVEQRILNEAKLSKECSLNELNEMQKSSNIYSRRIGTNFVNLFQQYDFEVINLDKGLFSYSVDVKHKLGKQFENVDTCIVPLIGGTICESELNFSEAQFNATCFSECNLDSVPSEDKQLCYSACEEFTKRAQSC